MFFYCVEPQHDDVERDFHGWHFTVKAGLGHHILFPHVDSCLGLICQLAGRRVFAGHINGFYNDDFSAASHQSAFDDMVALMGGATVERAAIFGNLGDGSQPTDWLHYANFACQHRIAFHSITCHQGIDVMFDVDGGRLEIMRYLANRNFRTRPAPLLVAHTNLYTIVGNTAVNC